MNTTMTTVNPNINVQSVQQTIQSVKLQGKAQPFGAHFTTRLQDVNSKLICALPARTHISDDDPEYLK
jgi:hypothetical protein